MEVVSNSVMMCLDLIFSLMNVPTRAIIIIGIQFITMILRTKDYIFRFFFLFVNEKFDGNKVLNAVCQKTVFLKKQINNFSNISYKFKQIEE